MGTRADFYVGRGENAEWLGSIAWDGHPCSIAEGVLAATTEAAFRSELAAFGDHRDDWTEPALGWPWPWDTSHTTDYAYAFDGHVWGNHLTEPDPRAELERLQARLKESAHA